jgi:NAD(P)H dehydrogenase (quinone)
MDAPQRGTDMPKKTRAHAPVRMLVAYYSRTGHTEHMARAVAAGAGELAGVEVDCKGLADLEPAHLLRYEAIVIGSPTYYGTMAAEVKRLLDESVAYHGQLEGKVGGAFSSSANLGGGNETTVLDILKALLIHGMIVQGSPTGAHYGPVAVGQADQRALAQCHDLGRRTAQLAMRLKAK